MPKVSIIVPVYNVAPFLPMCLCSIMNQSFSDWELIIVNDESTDDSLAIAQQYAQQDKRIKIIQQPHGGLGKARNTGFSAVQAEYVTFVDGDDYIDKDYLEQLLQHIQTSDICQCGYRRVFSNGEVLYSTFPHSFYQFTTACMRLYRTDFLKKNALRFESMYYEDVIFSIDIWATQPSYSLLPYYGYNYTINEHSITSVKHKKEERYLFSLLRQRARRASFRTRCLIAYTALRLRVHYLLGR